MENNKKRNNNYIEEYRNNKKYKNDIFEETKLIEKFEDKLKIKDEIEDLINLYLNNENNLKYLLSLFNKTWLYKDEKIYKRIKNELKVDNKSHLLLLKVFYIYPSIDLSNYNVGDASIL